MAMGPPYQDSENGGLPNVLTDTLGGQTFTLGLGLDYCTGTNNELGAEGPSVRKRTLRSASEGYFSDLCVAIV
jgi:hypothetical protein